MTKPLKFTIEIGEAEIKVTPISSISDAIKYHCFKAQKCLTKEWLKIKKGEKGYRYANPRPI